MTAKVSTSNFSTNFKYKVKSNFRIMIIIFILHLVAAPLNLINMIVYLLNKEKAIANVTTSIGNFNTLYPVIGVITTCLAAASGIIIAMNVYNYLYRKSVVDMTLALPLTTNQRFFSDFLAGAFTYLVPFLASSIIALIINGIGSAVTQKWSYNSYGEITRSLIALIVNGFFIMLMAYVLTVLVLSCCGSMFEALSYTIILNGLIPGTIAVFGYIFIGNLYGIDVSTNILPFIEKTSPIGGLILFFTGSASSTQGLQIKASWIIPFIIITAIYFAGSYFLYRKRKAESVSKPFVYKVFYYIMITGITFCIGTLFTVNGRGRNLIPLVIITAVIYLIFEVVTNRGFKKLYMSVIRYVITIVAVVGISYLFDVTEGFGTVTKIPVADNVKSIQMNYNGAFNQQRIFNNNNYSYSSSIYTDENTIKSVVKMHEMVIARYNKQKVIDDNNYNSILSSPSERNNYMTNITIKYDLKTGPSFTRIYSVNFDEYIQLMKVDRTNEYIDNYINYVRASYLNSIKTNENDSNYFDNNFIINYPVYPNELTRTKITENMLDDFLNSLKLDMKSISDEEYYTSSKDTTARIILGNGGYTGSDIFINDNYVNTLLFLKKYNIKLPAIDTSDFNASNDKIMIFAPNTKGVEIDSETYYCTFNSNNFSTYGDDLSISQNSDDLRQLLLHLKTNYIAKEPCYQLFINANVYTISPEYSDLAEKVYSQAKAQNPVADADANSPKYTEAVLVN